ncbi:MAG: polysaccharide deacetylase family protein [Bacillota bacterium]
MKLKYLLILILLLLGGLLFFIKIGIEENIVKNKELPPQNLEVKYSKYPGVEINTIVEEEETYHSVVQYPEFKKKNLNEIVRSYIKEATKRFDEELKGTDPKRLDDFPAVFSLTFDIYPIRKGMYSFVFAEESYVSGANGRQNTKIVMVDTNSGSVIQADRIINDIDSNRGEIYNLLLDEFQKSVELKQLLFPDALKEWVYNPENQFANMYITNKALVFKFNKYEVTAGAAGMPEISIPIRNVQDLLMNEWKNIEGSGRQEPHPDLIKEDPTDKKENKEPVKEDKKKVAITFDDGPHPQYTQAILDILKAYNARATFFVLGSRVDFYPDITKRIVEEGHEIGNHTWNHKDLTTLSPEAINEELEKTNDAVKKATGLEPQIMRPPYGAINNQIESLLEFPSILWSIDTLDWQSHNPNAIISIVEEETKDGSIILMHDIHESTVNSLETVLSFLQEQGYELVTVSELMN